jgi:hypothetical protein
LLFIQYTTRLYVFSLGFTGNLDHSEEASPQEGRGEKVTLPTVVVKARIFQERNRQCHVINGRLLKTDGVLPYFSACPAIKGGRSFLAGLSPNNSNTTLQSIACVLSIIELQSTMEGGEPLSKK